MGKGRSTVYNKMVEDKYPLVNEQNRELLEEWLMYLISVDRSENTIEKYKYNFQFWAVWNYENNKDKFFIDLKIKDIIKFQSFCIGLNHSPARIRNLRSCLSSLSNYVEAVLYEDYPNFRNIVNKIEAPTLEKVREKLVLDDKDVNNLLQKLVDEEKYQEACYLALAGYSGARKSELLRFKVEYFKDEYVETGLYKTPEKIKTKGRGKNGKSLNKWTIKSSFDPYLKLWLSKREELGIDSEWLFVTKKYDDEGKIANYVRAKISTANSWANTITRYLGQPFYAHSQRHYYCTSLVKAGIPMDVIKEIVGWNSVDMIGVYNDIEATDNLSKFFGDEGIIKQEKKSLNDL